MSGSRSRHQKTILADHATPRMTPHISGSSLSAQARYAAGTREILECYFAGIPIRQNI